MNTHREVAYRVNPALWMHGRVGDPAADMAGDSFCACPAGSIHSGPDRAAGRQNHRCGLCDGAYGDVHAWIVVRGRVSRAAPKCRTAAQGASEMVLKAGATLTTDNVYGSSSPTVRACWRFRAVRSQSAG